MRDELAHAAGGVIERLQAAGGMVGEGATGVGGDDAPSGPDEEVDAEQVLHLADVLGHRGLRDAERVGCRGEGAELGGGAEASQLLV